MIENWHNSDLCVTLQSPRLVDLACLRVNKIYIIILTSTDHIYPAIESRPYDNSASHLDA